jgi:flagellar protein FlgJ
MLRPDFAAAHVSTELARERERIALPSMSAAGQQRRFDALFEEVRRDISSFIAGGSSAAPTTVSGAAMLTVEGQAYRAKLESAAERVDREQQQEFLASIAPWARRAAEQLGIEPELVAAHAALESGWGQRPLRDADGATTHNLFGIKAGSAWDGDVVRALTTEVDDGEATTRTETFRSYANPAQAFEDYAKLLLGRSRYAKAVNVGGDAAAFASGLAQGRYATDPDYAQKIERVARQVREIGLPSTLGIGVR